MPIKFHNIWGAKDSGLDQQRGDFFRVAINLPAALGGVSKWDSAIQFAVQKFPLPERMREMVPIKYFQQINMQIGGDVQGGVIEVPVRYAFNQDTAKVLEQWHWMTAHPGTGGVALTSQIKANGYFYWMIPNIDLSKAPGAVSEAASANLFLDGGAFALEGILVKGLKMSEANMDSGTDLVYCNLTLQIDRYYPLTPDDLKKVTTNITGVNGSDSAFDAAAGIVTNALR